jgi:peptide/nickel transport system permease protein
VTATLQGASAPDTAPAYPTGRPPAVTPAKRVVAALRSKPSVIASVVFVVLVVILAVFAPLLSGITGWGPTTFDATAVDPVLGGLPIGPFGGVSASHWFGGPQNGRDIFARIAYGARVSMLIAVSATVVTTAVGVVAGMVAGYFGGIVDQIVSRVMDFLMAFPALIFMIAILSALPAGNRPALLVLVLSVFGWPYTARIVRGQTMTIRTRDFVEAARASGASSMGVIFREVLPNLRGTVIVLATLAVPGYIGTEAALSFLGVGVLPPTPSWGQMIADSVNWYTVDPAYFIVPGSFLFLTVLSFTVFGDHLRTALEQGEAA